ncbi:MAG: hypothetical protein ACTHU0_28005, partial [Kofleriaceae bacterium]
MRRPWFALMVLVCACSGDDSHKHTTARGHVAAASPVAASPAPPVAPATPAALTAPVALSESMATPFFTTGDAGEGAKAFALEK